MKEFENELRADISKILKQFTDDYSGDLERELIEDIVADVVECSDFENGTYSNGDIALAIGRVLCERIGIEK